MGAFISYSSRDSAVYSSLCVALEGQGVPYWDSKGMQAGSSLRAQLQEGIAISCTCVLVATKSSLESRWCLAEVGAFWGASKRVIVFIADSDVSESDIPPQFQGDLWTRDVRQVITTIKADLDQMDADQAAERATHRPKLVSEMSIPMLFNFLASLRRLKSSTATPAEALSALTGAFLENEADAEAFTTPLLASLLGAPADVIRAGTKGVWNYQFEAKTSTGTWSGAALEAIPATAYKKCVVTRIDSGICGAAMVLRMVWEDEDVGFHYEGVLGRSDDAEFGDLVSVSFE